MMIDIKNHQVSTHQQFAYSHIPRDRIFELLEKITIYISNILHEWHNNHSDSY